MDNNRLKKFKIYYEKLQCEDAKEVTNLQIDALNNNEDLPLSYSIAVYDYFTYIDSINQHVDSKEWDNETLKYWKDEIAPGYKFVSKEVYDFYLKLGNLLPIYDDLNFLYELNKIKAFIFYFSRLLQNIYIDDPIIATIPILGVNAQTKKLKSGVHAILINRSVKTFLMTICDLLDYEKNSSTISDKELNEYFIDIFVTYTLKKDMYFAHTDLMGLYNNAKQDHTHYMYVDIALTYLVAHEYWHLVLDEQIEDKINNDKKKISGHDIPEMLVNKGAKFYKELKVDTYAVYTVIQMFSQNCCTAEDIYEGFYLALLANTIDQYNSSLNNFTGQPDVFTRMHTIETYLIKYLSLEKGHTGKMEAIFNKLWINNKDQIGVEIVNRY